MKLFCAGCKKEVDARLTNGSEIYPHREDLYGLPFWICECGCYTGCHHKTKEPTKPLGVLANKELRSSRMRIHAVLDPLWRNGKCTRKEIYADMSELWGKSFHVAELRDEAEVDKALMMLHKLKRNKYG